MSLLRSAAAPPPPRTLVDIFRATVAQFVDATALDSGADQLTYEEFAEAAEHVADESVTTEGFLEFASARTGADVGALLSPWLFEEELPDLPSDR
jgi:non-ribosomal peptide synthetase component F